MLRKRVSFRRCSTAIFRAVYSTYPNQAPLTQESTDSELDPVKILVPEKLDVHKFAGKLAADVRSRQNTNIPIIMKATGTNPVNTAIKCLHIARKYLGEYPGVGLGFRVMHEEDADKDRISQLRFGVYTTDQFIHGRPIPAESMEEMWARSDSVGRMFGGRMAIALYNARRAMVLGIGPRSVGNAVVGLTWARRILRTRKWDVLAIPNMIKVQLKSEYREMTAVQFILLRVPYQPFEYLDPVEEFDDDEQTHLIEEPE